MSISGSPHETVFQFPSRRALKQKQHNTLTAKLQAALAREQRLIGVRPCRQADRMQTLQGLQAPKRLVGRVQIVSPQGRQGRQGRRRSDERDTLRTHDAALCFY